MSFSFNNTVFQDLRERCSTWEQLEDYLESETGGLLRVVDQDLENGLAIIRYEKGVSNMELPHSKWFRSVIWDKKTHLPVSIAPPKTASTDFPFRTCQETNEAGVICQEQLDGFMINCFKRAGDNTLYITSRSRLNASGHFHSAKSFRQLFVEAYTGQTFDQHVFSKQSYDEYFNAFPSPDSSKNEVAISWSFIVQHKDNRIVSTVTQNSVTLIQQNITYVDGTVRIIDTPDPAFLGNPYCFLLANASLPHTSDDVRSWIHEILRLESWEVQGMVLKDQLGNRWRFRSDSYTTVRSLRGNTPFVIDRFVQLYLQNVTHTYLGYYPEDATVFAFYQEMMKYLVWSLYEVYQQYHVRKAIKIDKIDKMYHPHLYALHGQYLATHKKLTMNDVYDYIRKQPWQRVVFLLRQIQDQYYEMIQTNNE
jgi:hypothetical protein